MPHHSSKGLGLGLEPLAEYPSGGTSGVKGYWNQGRFVTRPRRGDTCLHTSGYFMSLTSRLVDTELRATEFFLPDFDPEAHPN